MVTRPVIVRGKVVRHAQIAYTQEALLFKQQFVAYVTRSHMDEVRGLVTSHRPTDVYQVEMRLHMPDFLNSGWPKKKAKSPYKVVDVHNRQKVLLDGLVEALGGGIDDSLFVRVVLTKYVHEDAATWVSVTRVHPSHYGVPDAWLTAG